MGFKSYIGHNYFDVKTTDMPLYDNMLENPEYFRDKKNIIFNIQHMSPAEYVRKCVDGFNRYQHDEFDEKQIRSSRMEELIDKYKNLMLKGEKFPMPVLDYSHGFTQEGLHRAIACERLGVEAIPVMVVRSYNESAR